jgi:hypothetical protein
MYAKNIENEKTEPEVWKIHKVFIAIESYTFMKRKGYNVIFPW